MSVAEAFEAMVDEIAGRIAREHGCSSHSVRVRLPPDFVQIIFVCRGKGSKRRIANISGSDLRCSSSLEAILRNRCEAVLKDSA